MDNEAVTAKVVACKGCERPVTECGPLSARKLCHYCGVSRQLANWHQLGQRSGPYYEAWRRGLILRLLDLDTTTGASLDLISDEVLADLLSNGGAEALR